MVSYKVYIDSAAWICEGNLVDTSKIYRFLLENDHKIVKNPSKADYIIINSCGLTQMRRDLCLKYYEKYSEQKKENAKIIMFGCLIKIDKERIEKLDLINIDFHEENKFDELFYNKIRYDKIRPFCDDNTKQELLKNKSLFRSTKIYPFILSGLFFPFSKKIRNNYKKMINSFSYNKKIFVEISSGCAGNCSYCVIKKAKGNVHSRQIKDILVDIKNLYNPKKNLFLVADDCGSYGLDIKTNIFDLIYEINKKFPDIVIDLNYLNPYWLIKHSNEYIKLFSEVNINLASIPVQSGSNKILKKMNRKYDIDKVNKIIDKIKKVSPKTITYSHFLLAFPGENSIDFLKTLNSTTYFDLPIALIYSEHISSQASKLKHQKSTLTKILRYSIFLFFINIVILYKLFNYP
jgi:tRNA A37 methylthiotransferase MiaB